ncbi:MAG: hypothetical protein ABEJ04_03360 [Halobacteriaceae archaeon]
MSVDATAPVEGARGDAPLAARTLDRLEPYLDAAESTEPLSLVAVLVEERPAAWLNAPPGFSGREFESLLADLPVRRRPHPGRAGHVVAADPGRFDLLPDPDEGGDAFDLQMGVFLGYPSEAVAEYVTGSGPTTASRAALVRRGQVDPADAAYAAFTPWTRALTRENLECQIRAGKRFAHRLHDVDARCATGRIASFVAEVYRGERRRLESHATGDGLLSRLLGDGPAEEVAIDGPVRVGASSIPA